MIWLKFLWHVFVKTCTNRINYSVVHVRFIAADFLCMRHFVLLWVMMGMSILHFESSFHYLSKYLSKLQSSVLKAM